ncbi:MAG: hypothetical protein WCH11_03275, partial [Bdellovibrio sp.]
FPSSQVEPRTKESGLEMLPVRIDEILPDERVDFDVFLHLSENDRYLLYTPQGQIFGAQQKARLEAKGVRKLHVKKKALHRLKKYQAQNFLNSLLRNFKNQKKSAG